MYDYTVIILKYTMVLYILTTTIQFCSFDRVNDQQNNFRTAQHIIMYCKLTMSSKLVTLYVILILSSKYIIIIKIIKK